MVRITETVTSTSDVIKVYIIISYFGALPFYKYPFVLSILKMSCWNRED